MFPQKSSVCVMMHLQYLFLGGLLCATLPPPAFSNRSMRHADGLFTSSYSKLLSQLTAKDYLESLIAKRVNGDLIENQFPVKRHSDAVFTDNFSRYRKQMAAKKYLNAVLQGKRSVDDAALLEVSIGPDSSSSSSSSSSSQTVDNTMFDDIIDQLTMEL